MYHFSDAYDLYKMMLDAGRRRKWRSSDKFGEVRLKMAFNVRRRILKLIQNFIGGQ